MQIAAQPARLLGLGTAVPAHELPQDMVKLVASKILGPRYPEFERLSKSFTNSGIDKRYSVVPFEWFEAGKDWPERTEAYLEGATALFVAAAQKALDCAGLKAAEIDTIVTITSTGIATPTLDARAMASLPFRTDVKRVPVFGLGCAGGVTGLSIAARLAASAPGSKVLLVCVETCTLSFRADRMQKADIIATVLFGDGAAAACLSTDSATDPIFGEGAEHTWPDTLPIMGWDVDTDGFGVIFDRSIPEFVKQNFADAVADGLESIGLERDNLSRMICHPGGARVVEAIEAALHLEQGVLDAEREVLRAFGNMSAPTALFVLERVMQGAPTGTMMLAALGPGFTASMLPIQFD
ncbi:type III polyketide synthase [Devosia rhodophyticola]|uniref:Type III polyketide synthase n=1 Tax=Devosia rhodophyticola TaxID=3026423 RepID=A0ABY7Z1E4_9HYPH|nr:type III polyketide synthase [Devosia rhodophyticola]WDR07490.1 type III polyketide synthase [Devosia rhodophyticola]